MTVDLINVAHVLCWIVKQKRKRARERESGKPAVFQSHIRYRPNLWTVTAKVHTLFWNIWANWGHAVAQLVEALRYKPEGRGFNSRWCQSNFSLTSFRPHHGSGVDSASNRNEYQEYFLGVKGGQCIGLTTLPPSRADCLEIWEPQPPGTLRACPGLSWDCFFYTSHMKILGAWLVIWSKFHTKDSQSEFTAHKFSYMCNLLPRI